MLRPGLKNAIAAVFAGASWQRCRTHFMANLLTRVPKRAQPGVATMVRTIYQQLLPPRSTANWTEWWNNSGSSLPRWPTAGGCRAGHPGLHGLPSGPLAEAVVQQPQERLNREIRRRTDVVGIFPNRPSGAAPGGRGAWPSNSARMGRSPPLPPPSPTPPATRHCRRPYAGRSGLINIK